MAISAQAWLNRIWYGTPSPPWWLVPMAAAFGAISRARRTLYASGVLKVSRMACPVIIVGNLSVGGTGKTPLACWLTDQLKAQGLRPGIVTRGFGGSESLPQLIGATADPALHGDESVMLARRTRVPVSVGKDRPAAAQLLIQVGCNVIVSDDGLQHYALARDCEIFVVDGDRLFGNRRLLPAGPLREPMSRLRSANAIVFNGGRPPLDGALAMKLGGDDACAIVDGRVRPLSEFIGQTVNAIAGIGNPERFFNMLRVRGIQVIGHPLDDHVRLSRAKIAFADEKAVLMTEKDAVKCGPFADARHWFVPVDAIFSPHDAASLMTIVNAAVSGFKSIDGENEVG